MAEPNTPPGKLLASTTVKLKVVAVCVGVLAAGLALAPTPRPTPLSPPEERAAPLLEEQIQPRSLRTAFDHLDAVAARIPDVALTVPRAADPIPPLRRDYRARPEPAASGGYAVRVSPTRLLTHIDALDGRTAARLATSRGEVVHARVTRFDPSNGLVLLETAAAPDAEPHAATTPAMATTPIKAGALLVASALQGDTRTLAPAFVVSAGSARLELGGAANALRPGMPLFDLDGALVAIAIGHEQRSAVPIAAAMAITVERTDAQEPGGIGVTVQAISDALSAVFGREGVLISDVLADGPAAAAGILPGDVLLAVGSTAIRSIDEAPQSLRAAPAGSERTLTLLRRGREITATVVASSTAYDVAVRARNVETPPAPEARTLFDPAVLASAGIPPTAAVISLDWRPVTTRRQADRALRLARSPLPVHLAVGQGRFFAVVVRSR